MLPMGILSWWDIGGGFALGGCCPEGYGGGFCHGEVMS